MAMTIAFVSNCFNHHERFLCDELYNHKDIVFYFIQTIPFREERKKLGWSINLKEFPYCICSYEDYAKCANIIENCDALIIGSLIFINSDYKKTNCRSSIARAFSNKGFGIFLILKLL